MSSNGDQEDDKTIPPGRRSGKGSASVVPFLVKSLATKPQVPVQPEDRETEDPQDPGDAQGGKGTC